MRTGKGHPLKNRNLSLTEFKFFYTFADIKDEINSVGISSIKSI
jgi:hypothetical protein